MADRIQKALALQLNERLRANIALQQQQQRQKPPTQNAQPQPPQPGPPKQAIQAEAKPVRPVQPVGPVKSMVPPKPLAPGQKVNDAWSQIDNEARLRKAKEKEAERLRQRLAKLRTGPKPNASKKRQWLAFVKSLLKPHFKAKLIDRQAFTDICKKVIKPYDFKEVTSVPDCMHELTVLTYYYLGPLLESQQKNYRRQIVDLRKELAGIGLDPQRKKPILVKRYYYQRRVEEISRKLEECRAFKPGARRQLPVESAPRRGLQRLPVGSVPDAREYNPTQVKYNLPPDPKLVPNLPAKLLQSLQDEQVLRMKALTDQVAATKRNIQSSQISIAKVMSEVTTPTEAKEASRSRSRSVSRDPSMASAKSRDPSMASAKSRSLSARRSKSPSQLRSRSRSSSRSPGRASPRSVSRSSRASLRSQSQASDMEAEDRSPLTDDDKREKTTKARDVLKKMAQRDEDFRKLREQNRLLDMERSQRPQESESEDSEAGQVDQRRDSSGEDVVDVDMSEDEDVTGMAPEEIQRRSEERLRRSQERRAQSIESRRSASARRSVDSRKSVDSRRTEEGQAAAREESASSDDEWERKRREKREERRRDKEARKEKRRQEREARKKKGIAEPDVAISRPQPPPPTYAATSSSSSSEYEGLDADTRKERKARKKTEQERERRRKEIERELRQKEREKARIEREKDRQKRGHVIEAKGMEKQRERERREKDRLAEDMEKAQEEAERQARKQREKEERKAKRREERERRQREKERKEEERRQRAEQKRIKAEEKKARDLAKKEAKAQRAKEKEERRRLRKIAEEERRQASMARAREMTAEELKKMEAELLALEEKERQEEIDEESEEEESEEEPESEDMEEVESDEYEPGGRAVSLGSRGLSLARSEMSVASAKSIEYISTRYKRRAKQVKLEPVVAKPRQADNADWMLPDDVLAPLAGLIEGGDDEEGFNTMAIIEETDRNDAQRIAAERARAAAARAARRVEPPSETEESEGEGAESLLLVKRRGRGDDSTEVGTHMTREDRSEIGTDVGTYAMMAEIGTTLEERSDGSSSESSDEGINDLLLTGDLDEDDMSSEGEQDGEDDELSMHTGSEVEGLDQRIENAPLSRKMRKRRRVDRAAVPADVIAQEGSSEDEEGMDEEQRAAKRQRREEVQALRAERALQEKRQQAMDKERMQIEERQRKQEKEKQAALKRLQAQRKRNEQQNTMNNPIEVDDYYEEFVASSTVHITNLQRPFNTGFLKTVLGLEDPIIHFWIHKHKTEAYVQYATVEAATRLLERMNGKKWPEHGNPLHVRFVESTIFTSDGTLIELSQEEENKKRQKADAEKQAQQPVALDTIFQKTDTLPSIFYVSLNTDRVAANRRLAKHIAKTLETRTDKRWSDDEDEDMEEDEESEEEDYVEEEILIVGEEEDVEVEDEGADSLLAMGPAPTEYVKSWRAGNPVRQ